MKLKFHQCRLAFLLLVAMACCSCEGTRPPSISYLKLDEGTYNIIAPSHKAYVLADETLSESSKARRLRLLKSWKVRIEGAKR